MGEGEVGRIAFDWLESVELEGFKAWDVFRPTLVDLDCT